MSALQLRLGALSAALANVETRGLKIEDIAAGRMKAKSVTHNAGSTGFGDDCRYFGT